MVYFSVPVLAVLIAVATPGPIPATTPLGTAMIHMRGFAFVPRSLTVVRGTKVTIVNDDDDAHTATATDASFDSAGLDAHESWSHVFTKPGTYAYFCALHPYMKGVVIVRPTLSKGTV